MKEGWNKFNYWGIFEYSPASGCELKRCLLIREKREDCQKILNEIEKSNINFEVYQIEGIIP
jgi:hypothetical protein